MLHFHPVNRAGQAAVPQANHIQAVGSYFQCNHESGINILIQISTREDISQNVGLCLHMQQDVHYIEHLDSWLTLFLCWELPLDHDMSSCQLFPWKNLSTLRGNAQAALCDNDSLRECVSGRCDERSGKVNNPQATPSPSTQPPSEMRFILDGLTYSSQFV